MARNAAGKRELFEQTLHTLLIVTDLGIDFTIGPLQPAIGYHAGAAMSGAADVKQVSVALANNAVEVGIDEIESGRGPPVSQQSWFNMLRQQRFTQQRIRHQVDLAHRQVISCSPVAIKQLQFSRGHRVGHHLFSSLQGNN